MASLTSVLRPFFLRRAKASARFASSGDEIQRSQLRKLLKDDPNVGIINIHGKGYKLIMPNAEV